VNAEGIARRLFKGSIWVSAARAITNVLAVLSTFVLARLLDPSDFGLVALATTMLALVTAFTEVSMNEALVRHQDPTPQHFSSAWTVNALRGLLVFALFAAIAQPAAAFYDEPRLMPVMFALGAGILVFSLGNPRRIMLQRDLVFWQDFVLNVSQKLVGVIASIAIAWIYRSYWALVVGIVLSQLTYFALSYLILPFRPRVTVKHARELMSFSIWLTLAQIVNTLNWRFDHLLVGKFLGRADLGYYSVGSNLAAMPTRELAFPLTMTIFPGFAMIAGNRPRLAAAYQRAQSFVSAIALPSGIGAAILADPLVRLVMGEKWEPAIFIIQALAAVVALQTLGSLVQPLAMALGQTRLLFIRSAQMLALRLPIVIFGLYIDGLRGLVLARIATGLIGALVDMLLVKRFTGLTVTSQLAVNLRALLSVTAMVIGALLLGHEISFDRTTTGLVQEVATVGMTCALLYSLTTLVLWQLAGRPLGPEAQIIELARNIFRRLGFSRGRSA